MCNMSLLQYPKWAGYRDQYFRQERDLRKLLGDPVYIKNKIKYLHKTKLLN